MSNPLTDLFSWAEQMAADGTPSVMATLTTNQTEPQNLVSYAQMPLTYHPGEKLSSWFIVPPYFEGATASSEEAQFFSDRTQPLKDPESNFGFSAPFDPYNTDKLRIRISSTFYAGPCYVTLYLKGLTHSFQPQYVVGDVVAGQITQDKNLLLLVTLGLCNRTILPIPK